MPLGRRVHNGAELQQSGSPTIQSVINTSQVSIQEVNVLMHKIETLVDTLNQGHGTAGELLNDPSLARKIVSIADNLADHYGEPSRRAKALWASW